MESYTPVDEMRDDAIAARTQSALDRAEEAPEFSAYRDCWERLYTLDRQYANATNDDTRAQITTDYQQADLMSTAAYLKLQSIAKRHHVSLQTLIDHAQRRAHAAAVATVPEIPQH